MRKQAKFIAVLACSLMLGGSVPQAHAGLFSVSPDKERKMGDSAAKEIESSAKIVTGPVADWVQSVGQRLVAQSDGEFKYSFKVIDSPEINAVALPGGHIYIFTGIRKIARTDDELAAVLAHEITHAEQHHYARQYSKASKRGALLGVLGAVVGLPSVAAQAVGLADFYATQRYSRVLETEADKMGLTRMAKAGFNPQGMVTLLENMDKEQKRGGSLNTWFASHPDAPKRLGDVKTLMPQATALVPKSATP